MSDLRYVMSPCRAVRIREVHRPYYRKKVWDSANEAFVPADSPIAAMVDEDVLYMTGEQHGLVKLQAGGDPRHWVLVVPGHYENVLGTAKTNDGRSTSIILP